MNSAEHCVEKYCAEKFVIHLNFVYYNVFTIKVINQVFYLLFAINVKRMRIFRILYLILDHIESKFKSKLNTITWKNYLLRIDIIR